MTRDIHPLELGDIPELGRFLTEGFHAPADAEFAAPDVLRWKYFDPAGTGDAPRSYIVREEGRIVGHVGLCLGAFHGDAIPSGRVSTLHMIDWLGSPSHRGVGASLMLHTHRATETQYGLGGSAAGRSVIAGGGYRDVSTVPVFHRVLRPSYRLRGASSPRLGAILRATKDVALKALRRPERPRVPVELRRVSSFGDEIGPILDDARSRTIFTSRDPDRLNHFLRHPRGMISGRHVIRDGQILGFALLSLVRQGEVRVGKIVDCLVQGADADLWHAAITGLARELEGQGADIAVGFASTPWMTSALRRSGFGLVHRLEFRLRDKKSLIPRDATFHLTPIEADYAYT